MSGAAYSKPVSALQRSISYFFGAFSRGAFSQSCAGALILAVWRGARNRKRGCAFPQLVFLLCPNGPPIRHERSEPQPSTGAEDIGLWPSVHHAALARPQDCDRRRADLRRHSWLPANPGFLDDTGWVAGAFLRVCLGAPPSAPARRVVGTAAAAELTGLCAAGWQASEKGRFSGSTQSGPMPVLFPGAHKSLGGPPASPDVRSMPRASRCHTSYFKSSLTC